MPRGVGGRGPANIMRHLKGVHFPVSKQDLLEHAQEKEGQLGFKDTAVVCACLNALPQKKYESMASVIRELRSIGKNDILAK